MTLKIQRSARDGFVVFTLSGRIPEEHVAELQNILDFAAAKNSLALDLREVRLVDRKAGPFLKHCKHCEAEGVELDHCPAYIRQWIEKSEHN